MACCSSDGIGFGCIRREDNQRRFVGPGGDIPLDGGSRIMTLSAVVRFRPRFMVFSVPIHTRASHSGRTRRSAVS